MKAFFQRQHLKNRSLNRHAGRSRKLVIFMCNLLSGISLNAQILFSPQTTSSGSVVPFIQPKTAFNIYVMAAITYSDQAARHCEDSLFVSSYEGDMRYCIDEFDFTSSWLNDRRFGSWVNNPDPFAFKELDVSGYDDRWRHSSKGTWDYSYSSEMIENNRQTWKADEKNRLKKIICWNGEHEPDMELDYFYNSNGAVARISTVHYDPEHKISSVSQQVWHYDKKQRTRMMMSYNGPYHQFSDLEMEAYAKRVETGIRTGKHQKITSFDIESLLIYNNGPYGPEQVNYYAKNAPSYDVPVFVSDSIRYDSKGRICRYISGNFDFLYHQYWVELLYDYEPNSARLKQLVSHRYNQRQQESLIDSKSIQRFTYDPQHRISSSTEQQFHSESNYVDGKYTDPQEQLLGEDTYTFTYKP